jgi:hypothetical protein
MLVTLEFQSSGFLEYKKYEPLIKMDKLDFIKIINISLSKDAIQKQKEKNHRLEKIHAKHILGKGLVSRLY